MRKFPKIKQFRNTVQYVDKALRRGSTSPSIRFIGTVKTHGTNAGVRRLKSGQLNCQSRNEVKGSGHFGFVEFVFGIDGIGEGLVFSPADPSLMSNEELWFKVKGEAHKKAGSVPKAPKIDLTPEKHSELDELVKSLVTSERIAKGFDYLDEVGKDQYSNESIGPYLGYVLSDLKSEEEDTVNASGFTWKQFTRVATRKVRDEFFDAQVLALHTGERQ